MIITSKASCALFALALAFTGTANAAPIKMTYDPVATAISKGTQMETANLALDEGLAGAEYCPVAMDIDVSKGATVDMQLLAPCMAGQHVVLQYGLKTLSVQVSTNGTLITSLPFVATERAFTVGFGDGRTIETDLLAPGGATPADANFAMR